jgi:hypothetical protein
MGGINMLEGNKLEKLTDLILNKQITKVMIEDSDEIAEIQEVRNGAYLEFVDGVKLENSYSWRNLCFGCSIALLDYDRTLQLNGLSEY